MEAAMTQARALTLIEELFTALTSRDLDAVGMLFADDAVLIDPHYPQMEMRGRAAIDRGLAWGMGSMEQFGFTIVQSFESPDGARAMVEVDTHHILKGGKALDFPQVFAVDSQDGAIVGLRAYEPYGPSGIPGFFISASHVSERVSHFFRSKRAS